MIESNIVLPGEVVSSDASYLLQGHGTYIEDNKLKVNQLAFVKPISGRYKGEIGDIVVGVVENILGNKWYLDVGANERAQLSILQVNTDELSHRRKVDEDVYEMNNLFTIGDILSCEVQRISTRTSKYGRLSNGVLVIVKSNLIQRQNRHIHDLDCNIRVILGCNGYIWLESLDDNKKNICIIRNIILYISKFNIYINFNIINRLYRIFTQLYPNSTHIKLKEQKLLIEAYINSLNQ